MKKIKRIMQLLEDNIKNYFFVNELELGEKSVCKNKTEPKNVENEYMANYTSVTRWQTV